MLLEFGQYEDAIPLANPVAEVDTAEQTSWMWFFPDGREFAYATKNKTATVTRVRVSSGRKVGSLVAGHVVAVSNDGKLIGGRQTPDGGRLTVWDAKTQAEVEIASCRTKDITALDVSPDSSKVASGSGDGSVILCSLTTGKPLAGPLKLCSGVVWSLHFSSTSDRLAGCLYAADGVVDIWDVSRNELTQLMRVSFAYPTVVRWSDDGSKVFAGSDDSLAIINLLTGLKTRISGGFKDLPGSEKFIVSYSRDIGTQFWDATSLDPIGPTLPGWPILLSPDDKYLVSEPPSDAHSPTTVVIWSLRDILPKSYTISSVCGFHSRGALSDLELHVFFWQPLIDVSPDTLEAWYDEKLPDAEANLSEEIARQPDSNHHAYANRALVRARLAEWDASLADAQMSLDIHPTAIARIAKGIALSGKGKHLPAMQSIDVALRDYSLYERELLLLVKCIITFEAEFYDEALNLIKELTQIAGDKRMYKFVQAYMYLLLGKAAAKDKMYDLAEQFFTSAQNLGPFGKVPRLDTIFLLFGWSYDDLWFNIHQQRCRTLFAAGHTKNAADLLVRISEEFRDDMLNRAENTEWFINMKLQCAKASEATGDKSMQSKNYNEAILQYSAALSIDPPSPERLFVKRSHALTLAELWDESLKDAEEAIKLNPSSPWGYEKKHAALHGAQRYDEAIAVYNHMHGIIVSSIDLDIRRRRKYYIGSSKTRTAIDEIVRGVLDQLPPVLVDVRTGHLCDREEQVHILEAGPTLKELLSAMTMELDEERIKFTVEEYFQYAIFSHENDQSEELLFHHLWGRSIYALDWSHCLRKFCERVRDVGYRWAWIGSCCIDKRDSTLLNDANASLYKWHRDSALLIVLLESAGSPSIRGDLKESVWMTCCSPVLELLAPKVIRFYDRNWNPYLDDQCDNHKLSPDVLSELQEVLGVSLRTIIDFRPNALVAREILRLSASHAHAAEEHAVFSLIGMLDIGIQPNYGEDEVTLTRLLQAMITLHGDVTVLAWSGIPSASHTCLPSSIAVYNKPQHLPPSLTDNEMNAQIAELRNHFLREEARAIYSQITKLGMERPRFAEHRLYLPCIIFPVQKLRLEAFATEQGNKYRLRIKSLGDIVIMTPESLPLRYPGKIVLVHPWIRDILGLQSSADEDGEDEEESQSDGNLGAGDAGSDSDFDFVGDSRSASDRPTGRSADLTSDVGGDSDVESFYDSDADATPPSNMVGTYTLALRAIARLGQSFSGLLLQQCSDREYKRVATQDEIIVKVSKITSLKEIRTDVLEIL